MDPTQEHLAHIGQVYRQFNRHQRRPPRTTAEIAPMLRELGHSEEVFRSTRDNQPLVICWGVNLVVPPTVTRTRAVLAYEREGSAGSRFVLLTQGNVELLTDEQFRELSFPPGLGPEPTDG